VCVCVCVLENIHGSLVLIGFISEQMQEEIKGGSGWPHFTWKWPLKCTWLCHDMTKHNCMWTETFIFTYLTMHCKVKVLIVVIQNWMLDVWVTELQRSLRCKWILRVMKTVAHSKKYYFFYLLYDLNAMIWGVYCRYLCLQIFLWFLSVFVVFYVSRGSTFVFWDII